MTAIDAALSGMLASSDRLNAIASNVANQDSTGVVPNSGKTGNAAYQPIDTVQTSQGDSGGVAVTYRPASPAYTLAYQPDSPDADDHGLVAAPAVDPVRQSVGEILSLRSFQMNAAVLQTADAMQKTTLSILA